MCTPAAAMAVVAWQQLDWSEDQLDLLSRLGNVSIYKCGKNFAHTKHVQPLGYTQYHAPSSPSTGGVMVEDGKLKV